MTTFSVTATDAGGNTGPVVVIPDFAIEAPTLDVPALPHQLDRRQRHRAPRAPNNVTSDTTPTFVGTRYAGHDGGSR